MPTLRKSFAFSWLTAALSIMRSLACFLSAISSFKNLEQNYLICLPKIFVVKNSTSLFNILHSRSNCSRVCGPVSDQSWLIHEHLHICLISICVIKLDVSFNAVLQFQTRGRVLSLYV